MGVYTAEANNIHIQLYQDKVVFTTGDREIAKILEKICDEANITDTPDEYHYQGWITVKSS